jgi:aconitate hydratase
LVLTITQILRKKGVVGKFVEFFGEGVDALSLADRATIANMAPEYGATCGIFAIDQETLHYMELTGRPAEQIAIVEAYAKAQGLWRDPNQTIRYNEELTVDLNSVVPSLAGPKRPQDKVALKDMKIASAAIAPGRLYTGEATHTLGHHDIVLAAITSCTNTSNPAVLIAAGLLAQKATALGLKAKPWVKTSFAPGSQVVGDYLTKANLMSPLEALGFHIVGHGCTTCIGNSGPLPAHIVEAIEKNDLTVAGVLSGNRNFEGRINPHIKANYLASPPLVVAFALAGTTHIDLTTESIGTDKYGKPVMLADIWPSTDEINAVLASVMTPDLFIKRYSAVFDGDANWQAIKALPTQTYAWDNSSSYVQNPPYFRVHKEGSADDGMSPHKVGNIKAARILALLGDSITTDHISPAGSIKEKGPAGKFLMENGVAAHDFNSYGARRGNHKVMMRGTFANIRLQNEAVPEQTGGVTRYYGSCNETAYDPAPVSIYDASVKYLEAGVPLVVIAGREYGTGSSRDWAAKGTRLLGVSAVIAESFERIHRSNLVGMGILPLVFEAGVTRKTLGLTGQEIIDIDGFDAAGTITPGMTLTMRITRPDGAIETTHLLCRVDTADEVGYMNAGGILPYVLEDLAG